MLASKQARTMTRAAKRPPTNVPAVEARFGTRPNEARAKPPSMDAEIFDRIVDAVCARLEPVFTTMLGKLIEQRDQIIEVGARLEKKPRKKPPAEQGWVQLKEAAHQVSYSVESLRRYGDAGKFAMRLYKGTYFVRLPDVVDFIEQLNS